MLDRRKNLIRGIDLFREISEEEVESLATHCSIDEYTHGQRILQEGSDGGDLFYIIGGSVDVSTRSMSRQVALKTLEAGSHFGEVSLLSGKKTTASVVACTPCEILRIQSNVLRELMNRNSTLRSQLEGVTLARAKDTIEKVLK